MTTGRKVKISITVADDILKAIDRDAALLHDTRSGVIESWLRRAAHATARDALEAATESYYLSLQAEERAESAAIGRGASRAARKLRIDR